MSLSRDLSLLSNDLPGYNQFIVDFLTLLDSDNPEALSNGLKLEIFQEMFNFVIANIFGDQEKLAEFQKSEGLLALPLPLLKLILEYAREPKSWIPFFYSPSGRPLRDPNYRSYAEPILYNDSELKHEGGRNYNFQFHLFYVYLCIHHLSGGMLKIPHDPEFRPQNLTLPNEYQRLIEIKDEDLRPNSERADSKSSVNNKNLIDIFEENLTRLLVELLNYSGKNWRSNHIRRLNLFAELHLSLAEAKAENRSSLNLSLVQRRVGPRLQEKTEFKKFDGFPWENLLSSPGFVGMAIAWASTFRHAEQHPFMAFYFAISFYYFVKDLKTEFYRKRDTYSMYYDSCCCPRFNRLIMLNIAEGLKVFLIHEGLKDVISGMSFEKMFFEIFLPFFGFGKDGFDCLPILEKDHERANLLRPHIVTRILNRNILPWLITLLIAAKDMTAFAFAGEDMRLNSLAIPISLGILQTMSMLLITRRSLWGARHLLHHAKRFVKHPTVLFNTNDETGHPVLYQPRFFPCVKENKAQPKRMPRSLQILNRLGYVIPSIMFSILMLLFKDYFAKNPLICAATFVCVYQLFNIPFVTDVMREVDQLTFVPAPSEMDEIIVEGSDTRQRPK